MVRLPPAFPDDEATIGPPPGAHNSPIARSSRARHPRPPARRGRTASSGTASAPGGCVASIHAGNRKHHGWLVSWQRSREAVVGKDGLARSLLILVALSGTGSASAASLQDMLGKWRWQDFTIEVRACEGNSACARVIAGPKNVGMDLFASKLISKDGDWYGQITHPETKETYNTRFQQKDKDRWHLDGCTAAKVCLSGEFVRVK